MMESAEYLEAAHLFLSINDTLMPKLQKLQTVYSNAPFDLKQHNSLNTGTLLSAIHNLSHNQPTCDHNVLIVSFRARNGELFCFTIKKLRIRVSATEIILFIPEIGMALFDTGDPKSNAIEITNFCFAFLRIDQALNIEIRTLIQNPQLDSNNPSQHTKLNQRRPPDLVEALLDFLK